MNSEAQIGNGKSVDVSVLEKVPHSELGLPQSSYALLQNSAEKFETKTALRFLMHGVPEEPGSVFSYRELFVKVTQTANALCALGVGDRDTVSMLLPNLPQTHFTIWGAAAAGIFNPVNPLLDVEHIVAILNEVKAKVLVTLAPVPGSDMWEKALAVKEQVPSLTTLVTVDMAQFLPTEVAAAISAQRGEYLGDNVIDFDAYISGFSGDKLESGRVIAADDIASYFHTGGTTGTPKLAPHSHRNQVSMAWQMAANVDMDSNYVGLCGLPLFHVNAVFVTGLTPFFLGAEVILATPQGYRSPALLQNFWKLVEKYKISFFSAVPTILSGLVEHDTKDHDISSLQFCLCGAAPLSTELLNKFENAIGLVVVEGYGQTEGCCASTCNPRYGTRKIGSVGTRLPFMQLRTAIVDDEGRFVRECNIDEVGVIAIKGPGVFEGYKQAEQNKGLWLGDEWFNTGDLGRLDKDGFLWLAGRSKDLIIRGGHNIDPQVIEEALYKHPAVTEVAAVGKPDLRVGELPVAYIQLTEGGMATEEELLSFAGENIHERAAIPKEIIVIENMPLTAVGKIFKPDLRYDQIKRVVLWELKQVVGIEGDLDVKVKNSKRYGEIVEIYIQNSTHHSETIKEHLDGYAFKYELI